MSYFSSSVSSSESLGRVLSSSGPWVSSSFSLSLPKSDG